MNARRGDIWLVDFGDPLGREAAGRRPAVVLSADELNEGPAGLVIVVPLTTVSRGLPSHIEIDPQRSGIDEVSYARCEDVRSISRERLVHRLGDAGPPEMFQIGRVLRVLLEI